MKGTGNFGREKEKEKKKKKNYLLISTKRLRSLLINDWREFKREDKNYKSYEENLKDIIKSQEILGAFKEAKRDFILN